MIKVFLNSLPWEAVIDFYVIDKSEVDGKRRLLIFGGGLPKTQELSDYSRCEEPSFRFSKIDAHEFMKAMADAIAEHGIKTDSDMKREGKLEATEKHLKDMRHIALKAWGIEEKEAGEKE